MLMNFVLGISMMVFCLFLQGILVLVALRFFSRREHVVGVSFVASMRVTAGMMAILIIGNIAQVIAWGRCFTVWVSLKTFRGRCITRRLTSQR